MYLFLNTIYICVFFVVLWLKLTYKYTNHKETSKLVRALCLEYCKEIFIYFNKSHTYFMLRLYCSIYGRI